MVYWTVAVVAAAILSCASPVQGLCEARKPRSSPANQCPRPVLRISIISTPAEARELAANCSIFDGNVYLSSGVGAFNLSGLTHIYGDLSATWAREMTQVTASDLRVIGGSLVFGRSETLVRLSFPALTDVDSLLLFELPNLSDFLPGLGRGGSYMLQNVSLVWIRETGISNLDWLTPIAPVQLTIKDNTNLSEVSILGLYNNSADIEVGSNLPGFSVSFPNLRQVQNLSLYGCTSINLPVLEVVNETLSLMNSTTEELDLPRLREVQKTILLQNNSEMASVKVPVLTGIGRDVVLQENARLQAVNFPSLELAKGDISANGSFTKLNFPALSDVQGGVSISSTGALDCTTLDAFDQSNVFKARYTCSVTEGPESPPEESGSGGLTSGAKAGIAVGVVVGVAVLASGVWLMMRKKKRRARRATRSRTGQETQEWRKAELPTDKTAKGSSTSPTHEMSAAPRGNAAELDPGVARHELPS